MKKRLALISIVLVLVLICTIALTACDNIKYAGTYEMISISGYITANGQTTNLHKSMYEYYRIILKSSGVAVVESKPRFNGAAVEAKGKWKYEDGKILFKSKAGGFEIIEELGYNDGILTYKIEQIAEGITMKVSIILKKA